MHFDLMKKQYSGIKHVQVELLAKIRNPGNLKLQPQTAVCGLRFPMKNLMLKVSTTSILDISLLFSIFYVSVQQE